VSELYDTMKYDALHNRPFLETIFDPHSDVQKVVMNSEQTVVNGHDLAHELPQLRELYHLAKVLFE